MIKPALISVLTLAVAWGTWQVQGPRVAPPLGKETAPRVSSFTFDHPEWRVLQGERQDATLLRFEHAVHMNPATPQMQERLQAWVEAQRKAGVPESRIAVVRTHLEPSVPAMQKTPRNNDALVLSCVACHEPDASGRYMQPIRFEKHCVQCHDLGTREGEAVPHGSTVAAFLARKSAEAAIAPKPAPVAAPAASSGGPRRRPAAATPATTQPEPITFESEQAMAQALAQRATEARERISRAIKPTCTKCHGPNAEPDAVANPRIPDRWLPRSVFSHQAHRFMDCAKCHAQAHALVAPALAGNAPAEAQSGDRTATTAESPIPAWIGRTRDIMLPGIASCRSCHDERTPTRADCVLCHSYHGR